MDNLITFIIPTIGRKTLLNSLDCLYNQTNNNWRAIVIFDGIKNTFDINNNKIDIYEIEKKGECINQASNVRNFGINKAKSKWIAFLDDDDTISEDYVELFFNEEKILNFDVYLFRMLMGNRIIPNENENNLKICDVGISFILKKNIFKNVKLENSPTEDYDFLKKIEKNNYKIIISNYVSYYVRQKNLSTIKLDITKKKFINDINPFLLIGSYYILNK